VNKLTEETQSLRKQLASIQDRMKDVKVEKPCSQDQEFSVLAVLSKTGSIVISVSEHLLEQTTIDEQVVAAVSNAKVHASNIKSQISSVDYNEYMQSLKTHPTYLTHIAPHVSMVSALLAPHMETAQVHLDPLFQAAQTHYGTVAVAMERNVLPTLRAGSSQALGSVAEARQKFSHLDSKLGDLLEPVFKVTADVAPKQSSFLPKQPVDRLLLLVAIVVFAYIFAKIALKMALVAGKISIFLLRLIVWIPLKLAYKFTGLFFFVVTGFYCFGLCRRKKTLVEKTKGGETKNADKVETKKVAEATLAEVASILEESKKEGSLHARAKKLAAVAKSGKPSNGIKSIEGKEVSKETLKKALGKFKEVNVKELGL